MNQTRKMKLILLAALLITACGKTGNTGNTLSDRNALLNIDAFAAKSGLEEIVCDGEGAELSGVYSFKYSNTKLVCPNMKDSQMAPSTATYTCTQKDKDFSCVNQQIAKDVFTGCINKDGKFKMSFTGDPSEAIASSGSKVFLVGTLGKSDGKIQYTMPKQGPQGPVSCVSTGQVEVIEVSQ